MQFDFVMESVASGRQARRTERMNRNVLQVREDSEHRATTHGGRAVALHAKALATTATIALVWVYKFKTLIEAFTHKVELCPVNVGHAFRVN